MSITSNVNILGETHDQNFNCLDLYTFLDNKELNNKQFIQKYYFVIWSGSKKIIHICNDEEISIPKNHFIYLSPSANHKFSKENKNKDSYIFIFREEFYARSIAESINLQNSQLFSEQYTHPIKNTICDEKTFKSIFIDPISIENKLYTSALNHNILDRILLNGHLAYKSLFDKGVKEKNYDALLASKFKMLIQEDLFKNKQVSYYADLLYVTKRRLDKATESIYNKKAKQIIIEEIIKNAKILLTHTDYSIKDISIKLNFPQETNFTAFFKKNTCILPSEFKKQASN